MVYGGAQVRSGHLIGSWSGVSVSMHFWQRQAWEHSLWLVPFIIPLLSEFSGLLLSCLWTACQEFACLSDPAETGQETLRFREVSKSSA